MTLLSLTGCPDTGSWGNYPALGEGYHNQRLYVGGGDLNPGLHACALPTELSPQLNHFGCSFPLYPILSLEGWNVYLEELH